jgi:type III restriction enzyme
LPTGDQFGEVGDKLYLVRETKSSLDPAARRPEENHKIHCGGRHFNGALGVDFKVVTNADSLP